MPKETLQTDHTGQQVHYGAAALGLGLSQTVANFVSQLRFETIPDQVIHQAKRACVDFLGCAWAGSQHATIDKLVRGLRSLEEAGQVPLLGRPERFSRMSAALANGQSGHVLDFDDTHMGGVILHASSPMLAALLSLAFGRAIDGETFLTAFVAGFETAIRLGQAAPDHHAGGWHLTGTLGTVAAAAACANMLKLDASQCLAALGLAASQSAGMQQNRGTSAKSLHAGKAASNGLLAAILAQQGCSASAEIFEGRKGFIRIYSQSQDAQKLTEGLGERWELLTNGYKPYACGVVLHPTIDAMIALAHRLPRADDRVAVIGSLELMVCPDAIRITGVESPGTGLMSKFSIRHAAAVSLIDGAGGLVQFSDGAPGRAEVQRMAGKIEIRAEDKLKKDQAFARCTLSDGQQLDVQIEHATGTHNNPLSDAQLAEKFKGNVAWAGDQIDVQTTLGALWNLDNAQDIAPAFFGLVRAPDQRPIR